MSTIDKVTYTLTCTCGAEESASIYDKGSGWGGSFWKEGASFSKFKTTWTGGGKQEPELTSKICNKCGASPSTSRRYGI